MNYKRILIIGANGKVGKRLVKELNNEGYDIISMIRYDDQAEIMRSLGAEPVIADLEKDFSHTYQNIDAIIFTAGSGGHTGPDKTLTIDQDGAIKSIELAEELYIERYIMVSAQGAREPEQPSKIQHYYQAKAIADNRLINSSLNYTIFRPGRLLDEVGTGKVKLSAGELERGSTSRDNLARTIAKSVNEEQTFKKVLEIIEGEIDILKELKDI